MKPFCLEYEGKEIWVWAQRVSPQKIWIHGLGRSFLFEPQNSQEVSEEEELQGALKIVSPMPGRIIKILVKKGEKVKKGQCLMVLEAMKMEYPLEVGRDGQVQEIKCEEKQQVVQAQELLVLEED